MIRLRGCAATARRSRLRSFIARAGETRRCFVAIWTVAFVGIGGSSVFACPMCFGAEETAMIGATRLGILVMLGITLSVQAAFVGFFLYLRKHAKRAAEVELDSEWSELQRASRT